MPSPADVRKEIPFLARYAYWDPAAVGPTLGPVVSAMQRYYEEHPLNYGIGESTPALATRLGVDDAVRAVASLVNAVPAEVTLVPKNTTEALAMVIQGLAWEPGDEVIASNLDHVATYIPLLRLAQQRGAVFRIMKADDRGLLDLAEVERLLGPRTRLLSICHVSNIYGTIQPVEAMCALARSRGVMTLVDAAQSAGRVAVDVRALGCDFLALCGRKHLCGPQGTAALYVRAGMEERLEPPFLDGGSCDLLGERGYRLRPGMRRFQAGIMNAAGAIGLGTAAECWGRVGIENVRRQVARLTPLVIEGLRKLDCEVWSPEDEAIQAGIICFRPRWTSPEALTTELERRHRILIRAGHPSTPVLRDMGVSTLNRLSPHYYDEESSVQSLLAAIAAVQRKAF